MSNPNTNTLFAAGAEIASVVPSLLTVTESPNNAPDGSVTALILVSYEYSHLEIVNVRMPNGVEFGAQTS